jgi:hypothetical protein
MYTGGRWCNIGPPLGIFSKKFVNKNEIKSKINYNLAILKKKHRPPGILAKILSYPLPWNFNRVHLCYLDGV